MRTYEVKTTNGATVIVVADNVDHAKVLVKNALNTEVDDYSRGTNTAYIKTPGVYMKVPQ